MATTIDTTKSAIPTSALSTPQTPFIPAPVADVSNIYNQAGQMSSGIIQQGVDTALAERQAQEARNKQIETSNSIASLTLQKGQQANDLAQAYQTGGVNDLYKQLSGLNVEAQGLQRSASAIPLQLQENSANRGITLGGIAPIESGLLRQNALKQLTLAQSAAIAQGNYDVAKNLADQQVNAKYAQIDAEIAAKKINEEALYKNVTDPAIKKALEARMALTKKEEQAQTDKRAKELAVSKLIIDAAPVAPPELITKAKEIQARGGSDVEVAQALGKYGGDYLANEKLKLDMEKVKQSMQTESLQQQKLRGEISTAGGGTTSGGSANAKAWLSQYNSGAMSLEDIYTKIGSSKEALALKNEVSRLVAEQGGKRVFGLDDASVQAINAQIKNVDDLLKGDVGSIVGFVQGGLGIVPDKFNVYKQDALAIAKNLVSNQTLQALADAKSKGITFGALSEGELGLVADAAGRISSKLIKDKDGNITGFSGSEGQFMSDLKLIKESLKKSIETKTQNTFVSTGNTTADKFIQNSMAAHTSANTSTPAMQAGYVDNQK